MWHGHLDFFMSPGWHTFHLMSSGWLRLVPHPDELRECYYVIRMIYASFLKLSRWVSKFRFFTTRTWWPFRASVDIWIYFLVTQIHAVEGTGPHDDIKAWEQFPHYWVFVKESNICLDVCLNKLFIKQFICRRFEMPRRMCDATVMNGLISLEQWIYLAYGIVYLMSPENMIFIL